MYELERVVKKKGILESKGILYKGTDIIKLKNVLATCICEHSVLKGSDERVEIRDDGNYVLYTDKKGRSYEYIVRKHGKSL